MEATPVAHNAGEYRGFALAQLRILSDYCKRYKLNIASRKVELVNGVIVVCQVCYNKEDVWVKIPPVVHVVVPEVTAEEILAIVVDTREYTVESSDPYWIPAPVTIYIIDRYPEYADINHSIQQRIVDDRAVVDNLPVGSIEIALNNDFPLFTNSQYWLSDNGTYLAFRRRHRYIDHRYIDYRSGYFDTFSFSVINKNSETSIGTDHPIVAVGMSTHDGIVFYYYAAIVLGVEEYKTNIFFTVDGGITWKEANNLSDKKLSSGRSIFFSSDGKFGYTVRSSSYLDTPYFTGSFLQKITFTASVALVDEAKILSLYYSITETEEPVVEEGLAVPLPTGITSPDYWPYRWGNYEKTTTELMYIDMLGNDLVKVYAESCEKGCWDNWSADVGPFGFPAYEERFNAFTITRSVALKHKGVALIVSTIDSPGKVGPPKDWLVGQPNFQYYDTVTTATGSIFMDFRTDEGFFGKLERQNKWQPDILTTDWCRKVYDMDDAILWEKTDSWYLYDFPAHDPVYDWEVAGNYLNLLHMGEFPIECFTRNATLVVVPDHDGITSVFFSHLYSNNGDVINYYNKTGFSVGTSSTVVFHNLGERVWDYGENDSDKLNSKMFYSASYQRTTK